MQQVKKIFNFFSNKYIFTLSIFAVLMLFIDHNNIFVQFEHKKQLHELLYSKNYYQQQIDQTKKNLSDLQNNSAALEKYAREKFLLKKSNEDIFVVTEPGSEKNNVIKQ